jgi:uncharacterized protein
MRTPEPDEATLHELETRLGRLHARLRLGVERDYEGQIFGGGINFFHLENWYSVHQVIRLVLMASGLYWRGLRNAARIELRHNVLAHAALPKSFDGFTLLQLSDLHADMSEPAMRRLTGLLDGLDYDICVLTGDYRGPTHGPYEQALAALADLCARMTRPVYGVLGNHDTICMVPALERMGIRMLLNEAVAIARGDARIHLAGVDDAHYYRADNIEKAVAGIPPEDFSILLSHTPEIFSQAAHADFNVILSGHTHGGQICLPGGVALKLNAVLPRHMGRGAWRHHGMLGYTSAGAGASMVPVRFNCPPEITLHHLVCAQ